MTIPPKQAPEPIAIIGIGCRFPGGANNAERYWQLLVDGVDAITEIPPDRWNINKFYHSDPAKPGKTYARWGGFVDNIDQFEPQFFGISPREAARMDPQQRLLLEIVWEALEDGGQVPEHLAGSKTAVFVGMMVNDYQHLQTSVLNRNLIDAQTSTGIAMSIAANRISYVFDFKGPCIALDTACSSSLVTVHLACQSLWQGDSTLALAGGVNIMICPETTIAESKATMLSPDGRSKSFDARANGYVRGEGAGMVVLKPLSRALADGDPIYALIRGSTTNQDGHSNGLTVPNGLAQEAAIREVLEQTNISPQDIQYVEAHGTGTPVGDPIEANTLGRVLGRSRPHGEYCLIGSVKTNIGHLEGAAGIAGLTKVALALSHGQIPPHLHFETPNPQIQFEALQVRVPTSLTPWPENHNGLPRLAGVNSFGFGGTNAHILLQECRSEPACSPSFEDSPSGDQIHLLPISARSPEALQAFAQAYQAFLTDAVPIPLSDICYSATLRRGHHKHRLAVVTHSKAEMIEALAAFLNDETRLGLSSDMIITEDAPQLVFVFSGMGQQWWGMGRQLLETEPVFRETIEHCDALLLPLSQWSLLAALTADEAHSRINETQIAQPAILSLQVALAALWRSWGIVPDAIVGHSVGEVAAAQVAGVLSLEQAIQVVYHRSRLQAQTAGQGKMLAVGLSSEAVAPFLIGHEDHVSIGAINSPSGITLSGQAENLENIAHTLEQQHIFCRFLRVDVPYHSPLMAGLQPELIEALQVITPQPAKIPLYSTVTGHLIEGSAIDAHYWAQNIRQPVRFAAAIQTLIEADYQCFLEIGAHPVLSTYLSEILNKAVPETGRVLPSLRRKEPEQKTLLNSFGKLYTVGYPVDWQRFYPQGGCFVRLPPYPWQRARYWQESEYAQQDRLGEDKVHPLLGSPLKSAHAIWHNEIDLQQLTYLSDHRVQGAVVYPGAAYVEMALAAAKESFGEGTYIVEEIAFKKAFVLDQSPTLQFILEPRQTTFEIYSRATETETSWVKHATGKLLVDKNSKPHQPRVLDDILRRCPNPIAKHDCYLLFNTLGLQYGPFFQGIESIWQGEGEALSQLRVPRALETEFEDYLLHPALLDLCFQSFIAAVSVAGNETFLPVQIERVRVYARPPLQVWSYAQLVEQNATFIKGHLQLLDNAGNVLVDIQGFRCQSINRRTVPKVDYLYEYQWQWQARPEQKTMRSADYLPSPQHIAHTIQNEVTRLSLQLERPRYYEEIKPQFETLSLAYVLKAFQQLGWQPYKHQKVSVEALAKQLGIVSQYRGVLGRMLDMLQKEGILTQVDDEWAVLCLPDMKEEPEPLWKKLLYHYPAYQAEMILIQRCGEQLAKVLQDQVDPLHLLFPEGALTLPEYLYQNAPFSRIYNLLAKKSLAEALKHLPAERTIRILEIGAGTGGMTSYMLPILPTHRTSYFFTDVSEEFMSQAKQKFRHYPFIQYQLLDIENDPIAQGFEPHSYDIILAADALHATRDLRQTLDQVKKLLASEGWLILLEITHPSRGPELTFGLLPGWWLFTDIDLRASSPLLTSQKWHLLLEQLGFSDIAGICDTEKAEDAEQTLLLAKGPRLEAQAQPVEVSEPEKPGSWLIFTDNQGVGQALAERFKAYEQTPILISHSETYQHIEANRFQLNPTCPEHIQQLIDTVNAPTCRGIIHLWSLDTLENATAAIESAQTLGCLSVLYLVQALAQVNWENTPQLWLVTQATQTVGGLNSLSVAQFALWGLGRVIINEQPHFQTRMVDLSASVSSLEIQSLFEELWANDKEDEIVLRGQDRYVQRLRQVSLADLKTVAQATSQEIQPCRLENVTPGILDNLSLRTNARQAPRYGEVEIQVYTTGLNFKDVVNAKGKLANAPLEGTFWGRSLGLECVGKIVAIGEGVEAFQLGDDVVALAPHSFSLYTTTDARFVAHKPAHLNSEEAATLPLVFLTAYYSLQYLGKIRKGERVLIHAASGGVGLAAIQIAQKAGAEVFATASTPEKRAFLQALGVKRIMDSRTLAFADELMESTQGEGIDIVLNALPGKTLTKSLSLLKPGGRFIEIGSIYSDTQLGVGSFHTGLSFFAFDLGWVMQTHPDLISALFREVIQEVANQSLHPLPYRVFPIAKVVDAFHYMAQAKHIGKIVVSWQPPEEVVVMPSMDETVTFCAEATYLITGGLGGFGLAVAQWLVAHGARHLVLMGRSGATSQAAQQAITALKETGAEIIVAKANVTQEAEVARVLADIAQSMPPLRGIIHLAMVLDDAVVLQLNEERMKKVMTPKIMGAWNLHTQTLNLPLDFFVLFSSISSISGNPGQGNYAAANAFLDGLAHYRRTQGLPGLTVNWGAIGEVGYVAQNEEVGDYLNRIGVKPLAVSQALKILGQLLRLQVQQISVAPIDWQQWGNKHAAGTSPRFAHLVGDLRQSSDEMTGNALSNALLIADPIERQSLLADRIGEQVAKVLRTSLSKLDLKQPLISMGLDSLMAVELSHSFQKELGVEVPTMKLFGGMSIAKLATLINEQLTESQSVWVKPTQGLQKSTSIDRDKEGSPEENTAYQETVNEGDWVEGEL